jgi:hypothetical protein
MGVLWFFLVMVAAVVFASFRALVPPVTHTTTFNLAELPLLDRTEIGDNSQALDESRRLAALLTIIHSRWPPLARKEYESQHDA